MKQYERNYKEEWEKTRWLGYVFASCFSDKLKKPSDLVKFEWEKEDVIIENSEDVKKYFENIAEHILNKKNMKKEEKIDGKVQFTNNTHT